MSNALERGLDLLEILATRGEARVADLAAELKASRATVFRVLAALEKRGYAEHVRDEHVWRLGPTVSELAAGFDANSIIQLAAPAMADLRATSRETVNLAVLRRTVLVWAASFDGAYALRLATKIGETVPLHSTAVGKAVLGTLPENEWARFLPPEPFPALTPHTHRTLSDLRADVLEARSRGWASDQEESELSGVCVAAAIVGRDGRPVAAISVTSVAGRLPVEMRAPLGRSVQRWCEQISGELRGRMRRDAAEETDAPPRFELVPPAQPTARRRS